MSKKSISIFTLAMINVAALASVKSWPFTAEYGFASLFYYLIAALVFFFPISLVSAELATGWTKKGGVYLWVREAFGPKWGFAAVWLQWVNNIFWYPTVLSFIAATLAYTINPVLANNQTYTVILVLSLFWGATIGNLFGMKTSGAISKLGALCGTLIPGAVIITLGVMYYFSGEPLQISFSWDGFIPDLSLTQVVFFTGIILSFGGMEMSAVHALDVQNPKKNYPRAILLSFLIIVGLSIPGILSIAMVIPQGDIGLTSGIMQTFAVFFDKYNLSRMVPVMAVIMAVGLFGSVSTWIIGPIKGLLAAAEKGHLPASLAKENKYGVPQNLMIAQGLLTTLFTLMFFLMPTVSSAFWILTVLVAQLYLIMYLLVFAAAIRLRYTQPNVKRPYHIPGGKPGMWFIAALGFVGSLFALLIGYVPPEQIETGSPFFYTSFLIIGTVVGAGLPFLISKK